MKLAYLFSLSLILSSSLANAQLTFDGLVGGCEEDYGFGIELYSDGSKIILSSTFSYLE